MISFSTIAKSLLGVAVVAATAFSSLVNNRRAPPAFPLQVPYLSQAPDGNWTLPWSEACEEASLLMAQAFYRNEHGIDKARAKQAMQTMFAWEDRTFQKNTDTNAEEIERLGEEHTDLELIIKRHPNIDDLRAELNAGHPVIALVNMYTLYQEPAGKDSYHVIVLTGYDANMQEFLINDPARESFRRVPAARLAQALHDYSAESKEADGVPTVLFTSH